MDWISGTLWSKLRVTSKFNKSTSFLSQYIIHDIMQFTYLFTKMALAWFPILNEHVPCPVRRMTLGNNKKDYLICTIRRLYVTLYNSAMRNLSFSHKVFFSKAKPTFTNRINALALSIADHSIWFMKSSPQDPIIWTFPFERVYDPFFFRKNARVRELNVWKNDIIPPPLLDNYIVEWLATLQIQNKK